MCASGLLAPFSCRWCRRVRTHAVVTAVALVLVSAGCSDEARSAFSTVGFVSSDRSDWSTCAGLVREPRVPGGWLSVAWGRINVYYEAGPDRVGLDRIQEREVRVFCDAPVASYRGTVRIQTNGRVLPEDEVIELQRSATECDVDVTGRVP